MFRHWLGLVAASLLSACSPAGLLNAGISREGYRIERDLAYAPGEQHRLDLYVPTKTAGPHPVIVFYYGGRWEEGDKATYLFVAQALASQGYLVAIPDYRVYPEVRFPAYMDDAAHAFAWIKTHAADHGGDASHLFVMGHSAGAQIAALLALDPEYLTAAGASTEDITAWVGLSGPYDFLPLTDNDLKIIFGDVDLRRSQPINYANGVLSGGKKPPAFLATGDADTSVKPKNTYHLADALRQAGNDVTVKTYPGLGHIGMILSFAQGFRYKSPVLADVIAFLRVYR